MLSSQANFKDRQSMDKRYIIVGAGWAGQTIASALVIKNPKQVVGFVDDQDLSEKIVVSNGNGGFAAPVLGHSKNLLEIVKQHRAENIIIAVTHSREDHLLSQIVECYENGISVHEMPDIYAQLTRKIPVRHLNHHWVLPRLTAPRRGPYPFFRDLYNYLIGLVGFAFLLVPLFPLIAAAIKIDSEGSVLFRQQRVGRNGKIFTLLKFRTMQKDASQNGTAWTAKNDHRITRVGRWLRKYRLDELPQFINILKGDMALIGPRPEAVELVNQFKKQIPFYEYRYLVRPGITGWAQVNYENTCSVEGALEKLQYDLYWIKNRSLLLDFKIIFKSIKVVLTGFGAA